MSTPPNRPKIFHITHVDNLAGIVADGGISSDARRIQDDFDHANIGMENIKQRRLHWTIECLSGRCVGEFVPFYFCPRSLMLYIITRANHPHLAYRGGQQPIVHLQADLHATIDWAEARSRDWAFTDTNAAAGYAQYYNDRDHLNEIDWSAVKSRQWSDAQIRDSKQAEFLLYEFFPLELVEGIGVMDAERFELTQGLFGDSLPVKIKRGWYY